MTAHGNSHYVNHEGKDQKRCFEEIIMRPLRWIIPQRCCFRDNNELVGTEEKGLRTPVDVQAAP